MLFLIDWPSFCSHQIFTGGVLIKYFFTNIHASVSVYACFEFDKEIVLLILACAFVSARFFVVVFVSAKQCRLNKATRQLRSTAGREKKLTTIFRVDSYPRRQRVQLAHAHRTVGSRTLPLLDPLSAPNRNPIIPHDPLRYQPLTFPLRPFAPSVFFRSFSFCPRFNFDTLLDLSVS